MKKKMKYIMAAIGTGLLIAVFILARTVRNNSSGASGLIIKAGTETYTFRWGELNQTSFSGEIMNGKGKISNHAYQGIELHELFQSKGIEIKADTKITVLSEDNYSAEFSGEEIMTPGRVCVAVVSDNETIKGIDGGEGGQLVVYGDENAKRQVKYLKTITVGE